MTLGPEVERLLHQKITYRDFRGLYCFAQICDLNIQNRITQILQLIFKELDSKYASTWAKNYVKEICLNGSYEINEDLASLAIASIDQKEEEEEWKKQRIYLDLENEDFVTMLVSGNLLSGGTTGLSLWDASYLFADFLIKNSNEITKGQRIMELGCGTGFISLLCARKLQASQVFATDSNEKVLELLRRNITFNQSECSLMLLDWSQMPLEIPDIDRVVCCDVVFDPILVGFLLEAFEVLFRKCPSLKSILVCSTIRNEETFGKFLAGLEGRRVKSLFKGTYDDFIKLSSSSSPALFHLDSRHCFSILEIS